MQKSKLIQLLRSCSAHEIIKLAEFLASPYFNKDQDIIRFYALLRRFYPGFDQDELEKEWLYQQLFPTKPYHEKQMGYMMSKLNKLAEEFMAIEGVKEQPYQIELALLENLSLRGLEKNYQQVQRRLDQELEIHSGSSIKFYLSKFEQSLLQERHFERQHRRKFDQSIELAAKDLDRYYFLHRLNLSCAMLDRQHIFQQAYQLQISEEWIKHLVEHRFLGEPIIELYYIIFRALQEEENEEHFSQLRSALEQLVPQSPFQDLKDIYLLAINYCARKIRKGKDKYLEEALALYRAGIENQALLNDGALSPWTFTNVVKLSLRLKDYNGVAAFIQTYSDLLPEEFRENALHYNLAELYYYTKRFDLAQQELNQVAYSDLNYYLGARVLLAKIYYELEEEEPLLSLIASFTIFLKRNKQISNNLKTTYLNFCKILFQLVRRSPRVLTKLEQEIRTTALLTDRNWLLEVYQEIVN